MGRYYKFIIYLYSRLYIAMWTDDEEFAVFYGCGLGSFLLNLVINFIFILTTLFGFNIPLINDWLFSFMSFRAFLYLATFFVTWLWIKRIKMKDDFWISLQKKFLNKTAKEMRLLYIKHIIPYVFLLSYLVYANSST